MTPLVLFFTSWLVGFSGAASPGPVSTFCLTEGARRGFWAGPRITLGHAAIEAVMVILLAFGLGPFLSQPIVAAAIALFGGAFLLWMGWDLTRGAWTHRLSLDLDAGADPATSLPSAQGDSIFARLGPIPGGALISLSNPYWFLWWATIGAGYVVIGFGFGIAGLAAFYFGHILADLVWNSLLTFVASTGRKVLPAEFYRWLLITFGIFLLGFSVYFLLTGVAYIISG